jgi:hypothetical protein
VPASVWRARLENRRLPRLALAVDLVASGQATVAEAANLAGTSRQTIRARCKVDERFQVPSLRADGTPYLYARRRGGVPPHLKGQPMTHGDVVGVRRRHLDGIWAGMKVSDAE